ncbi:hypothetical protein CTA1_3544 [Colletotrichum tanaceti]|uniref:Uncharacterized protein n=1 Tax=Colletotrichum tanaceti TaxID=1306861 RepID=A0A4U6XLS9_9PEZI|nr:hypothetical protein CTA1_3544 [Colletotrichum tanaceti]
MLKCREAAGGGVASGTASETNPAETQKVGHIAILDTDVMVPAVVPTYGRYFSGHRKMMVDAADPKGPKQMELKGDRRRRLTTLEQQHYE